MPTIKKYAAIRFNSVNAIINGNACRKTDHSSARILLFPSFIPLILSMKRPHAASLNNISLVLIKHFGNHISG